MDAEALQQRLSQISTAWTLLTRAHGGDADAETAALTALVERYQDAVYRYLLACVRDPDTADELFQDFALRLVRGDFGRVDPKRGRFRDYVKSALMNLVINHQRKKKNVRLDSGMEPAQAAEDQLPEDEAFLADWRKSLLDRAWQAMAEAQEPKGPPFYAVLRFRTEHAELAGAQFTEQLNAQLHPDEPFTEAGLRKILQRARDKFTDLLIEEVAQSLRSSSLDAIEQELIDLGFQSYCRRALQRRREGHG